MPPHGALNNQRGGGSSLGTNREVLSIFQRISGKGRESLIFFSEKKGEGQISLESFSVAHPFSEGKARTPNISEPEGPVLRSVDNIILRSSRGRKHTS